MIDKKVSVLMAVYNAEDCVECAVNSIQAQTWGNLEIIICDDCSTDRTWAVLHSSQMAVLTGIEPAIFSVTGRHVNRYTTRPWLRGKDLNL